MLVRDYCDQKLDEGLNIIVNGFLRRLNELQERLRERDAIKAKMKRRLQMRRQSALGVLLVVILVLLQAGSTAAYACTSNEHCVYSGCGGDCVSTTRQSEPPCTPQIP